MKRQKRVEQTQADFEMPNPMLGRLKPIAVAVAYVAFLVWAWYVLMAPKA